jgi:hypothetical protein
MQALEFDAVATADTIQIPQQYRGRFESNAKVIVLFDDAQKTSNSLSFSEPVLDTRGFKFNREQANAR